MQTRAENQKLEKEDTTALETFPQFFKLAPEIKDLIWVFEVLLAQPRLVQMRRRLVHAMIQEHGSRTSTYEYTSTCTIPALLRVCQSSRELAKS